MYRTRIMVNGDESANKQREKLRGHIQQPQKVNDILCCVRMYPYIYIYISYVLWLR